MRNRIAGIMHWDQVGIAHVAPQKQRAARVPVARRARTRPWVAIAAATLTGVALVLTLRSLFGAPSARA